MCKVFKNSIKRKFQSVELFIYQRISNRYIPFIKVLGIFLDSILFESFNQSYLMMWEFHKASKKKFDYLQLKLRRLENCDSTNRVLKNGTTEIFKAYNK